MKTPLNLAEKKRSKFAYEALVNLEKAIVMTNAYVDRKYGSKNPRSGKHLHLKSSLKQSKEANSPKKRVRIQEEDVEDYVNNDHRTVDSDPAKIADRHSYVEKTRGNLVKITILI